MTDTGVQPALGQVTCPASLLMARCDPPTGKFLLEVGSVLLLSCAPTAPLQLWTEPLQSGTPPREWAPAARPPARGPPVHLFCTLQIKGIVEGALSPSVMSSGLTHGGASGHLPRAEHQGILCPCFKTFVCLWLCRVFVLHAGFLKLQRAGASLHCGAGPLAAVASCRGARAAGTQLGHTALRLRPQGAGLPQLWFSGAAAQGPRLSCSGHVGSSWTTA